MLITAVRSRAVSLPLQPVPYSVERAGTKREWGKTRLTPHRPKPSLQYVIVEIDSDDGITGVGEAGTDIGFFGEPVEEVQSAIDLYLGPKLLGKDPFDREQLLFDIDFPGNSCAKSGIDLALHDLLGKALGVPVCNLIGGSGRRQVLAVMEVAAGTPDGMARQCTEWVEQGVRGFKAKVGAIPEDDVERLAAIRAAVGPKIMLRADANQGYTPKEAIRLCRMCERRDLGLELLEQPVPKWDLAGMAQVRAAVDVLIEADEAAYTPHDVVQIIRAQAADVINIKIAKAGGLYQSKKIAAVAEAAGLECVIGTAWGLGVKVAAKLHLAAPTRSLRDGVEFTELMLHDLLLAGPQAADLAPPLSDGYLNVPLAPGLGVTLNPEKLRPTSCRNITHNSSRTSACVSVLRMRSSVPNTHCVAHYQNQRTSSPPEIHIV